jgi:alpha-tubulin suppressor-like RCC1 family protein
MHFWKQLLLKSATTSTQTSASNKLWTWGQGTLGQLGLSGVFSIAQVSSGGSHKTAITSDGRIFTWGLNAQGQLGTGDTLNRSSPTQVGGNFSWLAVSAGDKYTLAIRNDGGLFAWGDNSQGQLGLNLGTTTQFFRPTQVGTSSWTAISAGDFHAAGLDNTNKLYTWGLNDVGQLGIGTDLNNRSSPTAIGSSNWTSIGLGSSHSMAIRSDGGLFAWGLNSTGQLGLTNVNATGDTVNRSSPVQLGTSLWTLVSAGNNHTLAIKSGGTLWAWGNGTNFELGPATGVAQSRSSPTQIGALATWSRVSAGINFSLGTLTTGALFAWGLNTTSRLGTNDTITRSSPTQIGTSSWTAVSASRSLGTATGATIAAGLWGWGINTFGVVGDNTTVNKAVPTALTYTNTILTQTPWMVGNSSWSLVTAGFNTTHGILSTNTLYAWGTNTSGGLGTNDTLNRSSPTLVGTSSWIAISASERSQHTAGITAIRTLFTWGNNASGQLGDNTTVNKSTPTLISYGASSWSQVAAGASVTAAITIVGTLFIWGANTNGQLGDNTTVGKSSPTLVPGSWSQVSIGASHVLALRSNNTLWAWGVNTNGQLGVGDVVTRSNPVQVNYYTSWVRVSAGQDHSLAIAADGTLWGWGNNTNGQAGVLTESQSWAQIAQGNSFTIAKRSDGTIWSWGLNDSGQLGTSNYNLKGDTYNRSSPVQIGTSSWSQVFVSLSTGFAGAIDPNGVLYAWGLNSSGQLGTGDLINRSSPVQVTQVTSPNSWISVDGGNDFMVGVTSDKKLWGWGSTAGLNIALPSFSWSQVSGQGAHTLAIRNDGKLFAWGLNSAGQLGTGDTLNRSSPVQIGFSSWSQVDAGISHSLAVDRFGVLYAWGLNSSAQLGTSDFISRSSPTQVGQQSWFAISAGDTHSTGISNKLLYTWGAGAQGQLGELTESLSWSTVSAGVNGVIGITGLGTLFGWGLNTSGKLGINDTLNRSSPVQIGSNSWTSVAAYSNSMIAIGSNGLAYVWGSNTVGQLGLGKLYDRSTPTQINAQQPTDTSGYRNVNLFRSFGNPIVSTSIVPFAGTYSGGFNLSQTPGGSQIADILIDRIQINSSSYVSTVPILVPTPGSFFIPYATFTATAQPNPAAGSTLDFTWEAWIFPTAFTVAGSNGRVILTYGADDVTIRLNQQGNDATTTTTISVLITSTVPATTTLTGGSVVKNKWQHIALCRQSGVFNLWIDGTRVINDATITATAIRTNNSQMFAIGQGNNNNGANADYFIGYISNVRVVIGLAVYTTAIFTPPTSILQATQTANSNGVPSAAITGASGRTSLLTYTTERSILGGVSYTQVAAGNSYMMAVDTTGKLWTWGLNTSGQLASNDTVNRSMPVQVQQFQAPLDQSWTSISAGASTAAAISSTGSLFTWGDNTFGQLGQSTTGTANNRSSPVQIGASSWTQVRIGTSHALAIRSDRTLWAWGANSIGGTATGQLGNNLSETVTRSSPVQIGTSSWTQVAVGDTHTLGVRLDGTLWSWGFGSAGELGIGITANRSSPTQIGSATNWSSVAAGVSLSVARDTTGNVYVWGLNNIGQLGLSDLVNRSSPTLLGNILPQYYQSPNQVGTSNWLSVSAGTNYTLGLTLARTIFGWGLNSSYQLGDNTTVTRSTPVQIGIANSWSVIDAGSTHSGAITTLGQLYMWGTNAAGLGVAAYDTNFRSSPTIVPGTTSWTSVDVGLSHTSAIDSNYQLWVWGSNLQGQLGQSTTGTAANRSSPTQVGTSSWSLVHAGTNATYGIDTTGKLFAWGLNSSGETGGLSVVTRSSPTQIGTLLAAGNLSKPTELSTLSSWSQVNAGRSITAAIATDASLWTWGLNAVGQLGTGDIITRSSPTQIGSLSWSQVNAGGDHMLGLTTTKLLYVWGGSAAGQLGRGNTTNLSTPSLLTGIYATTSFSSVSAGISYSMATEIDGDLYAWGLNSSGQLGDGTTVNKSTPILINSVGVPTTFYDRSVYNTAALTFTKLGSPVIASDNPYGGDYGDTSVYGGSFYGPNGSDALQGPIPAANGLYQFNLIGDFTIEGWVKRSGTNSNTGYVAPILTNDDGNYPGFFSLGIQDSSGRISVDIPGVGVQFTGSVLAYDTWYHIAMVRSKTAGNISVYLNGTLNTPVSGSNPFTSFATNDIIISGTGAGANLYIGKMPSQDAFINGFIHAVRLTRKAVYTGNFTVPIVPYGITNPASTNIAAVNSTDVAFLGCCELTPFIGKSFVQVSAGPTNGGAISDTGRALVWGTGNVGQTAEIFSTVNRSFITQVGVIYPLQSVINTPSAISQRSNWTAVSAGSGYSMAIRGDGKLFAWGQNFAQGLLGTGDTITRSSPVQIGTNNWKVIETGVSHVAGITSS